MIPREPAGVSDRAGGRWQVLFVAEEQKIISVRMRAGASVINGALRGLLKRPGSTACGFLAWLGRFLSEVGQVA